MLSDGEKPNVSSEMDRASALLNWAGARLMRLEGVVTVGLWSDLDCPEIREALRVLGIGDAPVRYVDGSGIPDEYKLRLVVGDPVPLSVLRAMERRSADPWTVRDELLSQMGWPGVSSWDAWIRRRNDRIFSRGAALCDPKEEGGVMNHYYPGADDEEGLSSRHQPAGGSEAAAKWRRALRLASESRLDFRLNFGEGDDAKDPYSLDEQPKPKTQTAKRARGDGE